MISTFVEVVVADGLGMAKTNLLAERARATENSSQSYCVSVVRADSQQG